MNQDQRQFSEGVQPTDPNVMPEELQRLYREMHPLLLAHQLSSLGLFGTLKSPDDVSRHNYAVEVLVHNGMLRTEMYFGEKTITLESMAECVRKLLEIESVTTKEA